jgi:GNAT superfamily N-acetyltransferase
MNIEERQSSCFRLSVEREGKEVGRAYLYLIRNDLREAPYGFMEDVFVDESCRGQGIGTELTNAVVTKAKEVGCYKLLATSRTTRPEVHALYEKLGFIKWGFEFRMDLV